MIEDKKNILNLELRSLLSIIDIIYGEKNKYPDYDKLLNEKEYLEQQIFLAREAKNRLINIFKD